MNRIFYTNDQSNLLYIYHKQFRGLCRYYFGQNMMDILRAQSLLSLSVHQIISVTHSKDDSLRLTSL